ncbi:MAG: gliding motility-associated ABC transporter ATP-binding subunit GldA [Bacteroidales bacterium]
MSIKARGLTKYYGKQKALDSVSFEVKPGKIVGFIGPNGAGKTTAMKILTGYMMPSSGEAWINGRNALEEILEIRKDIGYLPEHNPLYDHMYIKEYLEYVSGLYQLGSKTVERINEVIDLTGLEKEKTKKIQTLSKGYRQRVGLAQAIIHDPGVLILDEPTTGLDPNQIAEIRNLISRLGEEKTVLLSTHIMQEVEAICDRIIVINNGRIVADDKVENISSQLEENKQTVQVEFDREVREENLSEIEGVNKIRKIDAKNWLLEGMDHRDIRQQIFDFAVQSGLSVLSMQKKEKSLEQVFQDLTRE